MSATPAPADLTDAARLPLWTDRPDRPPATDRLEGPTEADLVVVGGGLTGLWAALQAAERSPGRDVVLLEAGRVGDGASGRNGGFCSSSITHGLAHGLERFGDELPDLLRLGDETLDAIEAALVRHGVDGGWERTGELTVAVAPWQADELVALAEDAERFGLGWRLHDEEAVRARVASPTYVAGLEDPRGCALVDPARLVWGLRGACERRGVRVHEQTPALDLADDGAAVRVRTPVGSVRARRVLLATAAFPPLLRRLRSWVVPVWDYVIATEPLAPDVRASLGWSGRQGIGDAGNQFHYYRLTDDDRVVFGGYDALYRFGGGDGRDHAEHEPTWRLLAAHLATTFPQLEGVRVTHTWGGAIDTCSRFTAFWGTAHRGRVAYVLGFTGLGVGASHFGAATALDLLDGLDTERTRLRMVRRRPVPFPPEPLRWTGIQLTRRALARADARDGRRGPWLRLLDAVGMGFDS